MSEYRDTEIGLLPNTWEVVEIEEVFKFTSGKTKPKDTSPIPTEALNIPVYGGNDPPGRIEHLRLGISTLPTVQRRTG